MIDKSHGEKPFKKVIAQQVERIYPHAVSKSTNTIPDIYQLAECINGNIKLKNDLSEGQMVKLIFENKEVLFNFQFFLSLYSKTQKTKKMRLYQAHLFGFLCI